MVTTKTGARLESDPVRNQSGFTCQHINGEL